MGNDDEITFEEVLELTLRLSPQEQAELAKRLAETINDPLIAGESLSIPPRRSAHGILAHLGPAPSAEEIDEARREAWRNFPREEFYL